MQNSRKRQQLGVALLVVIIAILLVTAVAAAMITYSTSEVKIDANYRDEQVALLAAKAGLEEARDRMLPTNANPITLPTALPGGASSVDYITSAGVSPWLVTNTYYDTEFANELTAAGLAKSGTWWTSYTSNASYSGPAANPVPYKWIRVNLKVDGSASPYSVDGVAADKGEQVCYYADPLLGPHEVVIAAANCPAANSSYYPVYEVTSLAATPNNTYRMLEEEVVKDILNIPIAGALTIDGPANLPASVLCASGSTCNSSGAYITGNEPVNGGPDSTCAGGAVPAIAVGDNQTLTNFQTGLASNKSNITGSTGTTPSVTDASSALSGLNTVSDVEQLISTLTSMAGSNVCTTSCGSLNLGTAASPTVTVVDNACASPACTSTGSAFQLNSGTTGYGILVVTGTLDYVNVNSYQGIILMLGTAQFISSSSKDTTFTGAIIMANDRSTTTGALLAGPTLGTSTVFNYHHGNASSTDPSIQYDSCVVNSVEQNTVSNYRVLSQRQLTW